jgi:hypothetical protein
MTTIKEFGRKGAQRPLRATQKEKDNVELSNY